MARAIAGRRDRLFVVSKVYPHNAGRKSAISACERSLRRLGTDRLDLYLLHWRGQIPLAETVAAFERLRADGKIVRWGVSNFDTADMRELFALAEGRRCATNQVLYHLGERGIEWELLPWLRERRIPVMAYSPLGQGAVLRDPKLASIARRIGATPAQIALRWLLRSTGCRGHPGIGRSRAYPGQPGRGGSAARSADARCDRRRVCATGGPTPLCGHLRTAGPHARCVSVAWHVCCFVLFEQQTKPDRTRPRRAP